MAKSVIVLGVILTIIVAGSAGSYFYTNSIIEHYEAELDSSLANPQSDKLKSIEKAWENDKGRLMLLSNHRDIEEVSASLIRGRSYAEQGMSDMAVQELSVARFKLKELIEREKIMLENIF